MPLDHVDRQAGVAQGVDTAGSVRYQTPSVVRVLGYLAVDLDGKSISHVVHPDDVGHLRHFLDALVAGGGVRSARRTVELVLVVPEEDAALVLAATLAYGQGFGRRYIEQNDPPPTEFVAARWHFGTNGYIGHMGWSHNYPQSDQHLNQFLMRATGLDVEEMSYRIVELDPKRRIIMERNPDYWRKGYPFVDRFEAES